jgi:crotonobetainyl-CoA:carnitine CoA-transferase CaiB-like acyl-CoA transferase
MVGVLANQALNYQVSGNSPTRLGNAHPNIAPYQVFAASDGHFILAVGNDGQFRKACAVLGLDDVSGDPAFATNPLRVATRERLSPLIGAATRRRSKADLLAAFEAAGVPAGPINTVAEVFADPQVIARGMALEFEGGLKGVRTPVRLSDSQTVSQRSAPGLGEHTADILANGWG